MRTKSFGYSLYNLLAWMTVARFGEWVGVDVWQYRSPNGAGIKQAIDFVAPYVDSNLVWPHEQIATLPYERLYVILLEAAHVYGDDEYQAYIAKLDVADSHSQLANLLWAACNH